MGLELVAIATSQDNPDLLREADAYVALVRSEIAELESQIQSLQALPVPPEEELAALRDRLVDRQVILVETIPRSSENRRYQLEYIETPATESVPPQPLYFAALAAMVGLLVAAAIAFILEYSSDKMRDGRQATKATGAPFVGTVIEKRGDARRGPGSRVVTLLHPRSAEAEAYRRVRGVIDSATYAAAGDQPGRGLLITGPAPSDSIAVVAANIAVAYAQSGERTVLIDADFEAPVMHALLGVNKEPGLTTMLAYPARSFAPIPGGHPMLRVVPSGSSPSNPSDFVAAIPLTELLARIRSEADVVVVKGPSLPGGPDATVLSRAIGATLLVAVQGAGASPSGVVLLREVRGSHGRSDVPPLDKPDTADAGHRNAKS
jgi:Mrp family chromosome partitioning ATPase